MAKNRKNFRRHHAQQQAPAMAGADKAWLSGFDGANHSTARGRIWFPELETRRELDSFSRRELVRRVRFLHANVGFTRGLIRNSADMLGWLTPQAKSGDKDWRRDAERAFTDRCMTAGLFDVNGKFDFHSAQPMLNRGRFKDGDMLTVLTEWGDRGAAFAFYESHQLANPRDSKDQNWQDGVLTSPGGRHLAYGLRDSRRDEVVVVPASSCIYYGDFECPGHVRSVPPLAHAVNHAIDITETWGFTKKAIKNASLLGTVVEPEANSTPRARQGMTGGARIDSGETARFSMAEVWDGGQNVRLGPGDKIKVLQDARPSPESQEFNETLVRDISVGWGLPPEVTWQMGRMTGPGVRFVLDMAGRWVEVRRKPQEAWARKIWNYVIAKEIAAKRLRMPVDGRWMDVSFTAQRSLTIDRAKESRSRLDEIDAGVGTWESWEEIDGIDWEERTLQRIREIKFAADACAAEGLPYDRVFPKRQGAPSAPAEELRTPVP